MKRFVVLVRALRVALVLVALATTASCDQPDEYDEEPPSKQRVDPQGHVVLTDAEQNAIALATTVVEAGTLTTATLRFGTVVARPQEDTSVIAPATARLKALASALGDTVAAGDPLVIIEPLISIASRAGIEAQRRQLHGKLKSALAKVEAGQVELERVKTLADTGLATQAERAQAEAALRSERARAESLRRAGTELGQITSGAITLRAPNGGAVATLAADLGSLVQQGDVLARIVQDGPRWIDLAVPPDDPAGDGYRVVLSSGALSARLLARGTIVQADGARRDRLRTTAEAANGIPPGATVSVEVLHERQGFIIPVGAIVRRGMEELVFVEVDKGRFAPRPVSVAARERRQAVITSGLAQGEHVVARGAASLLGELGIVGRDGREAPE